MTRKGKKRLVIVSLVVVGAVGLFAWGVHALTSEHSDYVRAAKELPAARAMAEATFGPFTWEEYRRENGIEDRDDLAEWKQIAASIPSMLDEQITKKTLTSSDVYVANRAWYGSLLSAIDGLTIQHEYKSDGSDWNFEHFAKIKQIARACHLGLVGAADLGDYQAVLKIGRAMNFMCAALIQEPDMHSTLVSHAIRAIASFDVLRAAVRNRTDAKVIGALRTILDEAPIAPTTHEVMSSDVRSMHVYLEQLRNCPQGDFDELLSDWGAENFEAAESGAMSQVLEVWNKLTNKEATVPRKVGPNTAAALEARVWQLLTRADAAYAGSVANDMAALQEFSLFEDRVRRDKDRSYEFALVLTHTMFFESFVRREFSTKATRAALELIARCRTFGDVPSALPADLSFLDPFGGKPILYKKTPLGFVIYTRGMDLKDDGFIPQSADTFGAEGSLLRSLDSKDWGVVVSFVPNSRYD